MRKTLILFCFLTNFASAKDNWNLILLEIRDSIAVGSFAYASTLAREHLDRAKLEENSSALGQLYFGVALGYYRSNPTAGIPYLDSSIYWTDQGGHMASHIKSVNAKSTFLKKLGRLNEAKSVSLKAYAASKENAPDLMFLGARNLSITYRNLGKYDSALYYVLIADSLAQVSGNQKQQYLSRQGASNIYLDMKNYEEALKMIRTLINGDSEVDQMYEWMNLGLAYLGLKRLDSAIVAFNSSISIAKSQKDSIALADLFGHLGETYMRSNQLEKAIANLNRSLSILGSHDPKDIVAKNNIFLARSLFQAGRPKEALIASNKAYDVALSLDHSDYQLEALEILSVSSSSLRLFEQAYRYSSLRQELSDQINETKRVETIEELKTRYEIEEREREINSLAQKNKIKDLQLNQQKIVIIASFGFFFLLVIAAVLFYRQYKTRTKQRQLVLEQDVLRTQMNPHFIFNALASIQGLITRNQRKEAATYLAKFGELTRDILEASRKELIAMSKEIEMINNYVHLEQVRFSKSLQLEISKEGFDAEDVLVPPMILQPFIENSIKHGFKDKESGLVKIFIKKLGSVLHFEVTDNGNGLRSEALSENNSHALAIIRQRLQPLRKYKKHLTLNITNHTDGDGRVAGVLVRFSLPIINAH